MELYRALDAKTGAVVCGLPSYGYESKEIKEIGLPEGNFVEVAPETLGRFTGFKDGAGKQIFTGDVTELVISDADIRYFVVKEKMVDRELVPPEGFMARGKNVVRIRGIVFEYGGVDLFPSIDKYGQCDTARMLVVGNIHTESVDEIRKRRLRKR